MALQRSDTGPETHPRVHLDLSSMTLHEQAAEIESLLGLGATRVSWKLYPVEPDFRGLAIRREHVSAWSTPATRDVDRWIG